MGQSATLQQRFTLVGDTSIGDQEATQEMDRFLDVGNWAAAIVTLHTMTIAVASGDAVEIGLGTMATRTNDGVTIVPAGPAAPLAEFAGITSNRWYKQLVTLAQSSVSTATFPIDGLLGWHVDVLRGTTGGPYSITFEIFVTLKKPA